MVMDIKKIAAVVSLFVIGVFWLMLGVGVGVSVVLDNDQIRDALVIGSLAGLGYYVFTVAIARFVWGNVIVPIWRLEE